MLRFTYDIVMIVDSKINIQKILQKLKNLNAGISDEPIY